LFAADKGNRTKTTIFKGGFHMSISGVPSVGSPQTPLTAAISTLPGPQPAATAQDATKAAEPASQPTDTVHLSGSAQAKALKASGQSPAEIAQTMNTDIKTVDGYLGIQATATTTTPSTPPVATAAASPTLTLNVQA
jgi:predicted flap endonuclease-1-like 5' DNA nuclease